MARILALDVHYEEDTGYAAAVSFASWSDPSPAWVHRARVRPVAPYRPGQFFRRELPCLLALLEGLPEPVDTLVVDGYAQLPGGRPGLGAHLRASWPGSPTVVGVSKNRFHDDTSSAELRRGESTRPLFVTALGVSNSRAADWIASMDGPHRIPTLLALVDRIARESPRA